MENITEAAFEKPSRKINPDLEIFLRSNGIPYPFRINKIQSGRNSQVYRIDKDGRQWILKVYHRHKDDLRERLTTEFNFLTFLNSHNIGHVATAIASDSLNNWGLYSFLPGAIPVNINSALVKQAAGFIQQINKYRNDPAAKKISTASEACFSIKDHVVCIQKRLQRFNGTCPIQSIENKAYKFVQERLIPVWNRVKDRISSYTTTSQLEKKIPISEWILSPSDFGFQNTLEINGTLNFLDFEYAGWDDPAKLICDFSAHPEIPIDNRYSKKFMESFHNWHPTAVEIKRRVELLMPIYRTKWCCIILNEFTSTGLARRKHAGFGDITESEKQLEKAIQYFHSHLHNFTG